MTVNVHERTFHVPASDVAALVMTLASRDDRLWAHECWPRMKFDLGLAPGGVGGHGPVGYAVQSVDPTGEVIFRFTAPVGFDGWHAFRVIEDAPAVSTLRHELHVHPRGWVRLTWPLFFRPLHDALLEESLDKATLELGEPLLRPYQRGLWVRLLRAAAISLPKSKGRRTATAA